MFFVFQFPYRQMSEYQNNVGVDCMNKSDDLYDKHTFIFSSSFPSPYRLLTIIIY